MSETTTFELHQAAYSSDRMGPNTFDTEVDKQFGSFGGATIDAYAVETNVGVDLGARRDRFRIGLAAASHPAIRTRRVPGSRCSAHPLRRASRSASSKRTAMFRSPSDAMGRHLTVLGAYARYFVGSFLEQSPQAGGLPPQSTAYYNLWFDVKL